MSFFLFHFIPAWMWYEIKSSFTYFQQNFKNTHNHIDFVRLCDLGTLSRPRQLSYSKSLNRLVSCARLCCRVYARKCKSQNQLSTSSIISFSIYKAAQTHTHSYTSTIATALCVCFDFKCCPANFRTTFNELEHCQFIRTLFFSRSYYKFQKEIK